MRPLVLALLAALATAPPASAGDAPGAVYPSSEVIGNSALPFRVSGRTGVAALSGGLADYMDGGLLLGVDVDIPVGRSLWVDVPITIVHRRELKHPLNFPYTDDRSYASGFAPARGYYNSVGLGLRWEPRLDLERQPFGSVTRLETSVRAGWTRAFVGWEPRPEWGGGASTDYGTNQRFAYQSGWGPYGGLGLSAVRYSDGDFTVAGVGAELFMSHVSAEGDELLPVGSKVSGTLASISLRVFLGSR
ncbi:MAG: hypothetical protein HZB25_09505 [Candidatus Eisenbacteria bacterium]|nr:hypothetical protein [Candidatus Eisenbacteria bacterium]